MIRHGRGRSAGDAAAAAAGLAATAVLLAAGCGGDPEPEAPGSAASAEAGDPAAGPAAPDAPAAPRAGDETPAPTPAAPGFRLVDVTETLGVRASSRTRPGAALHMPAVVGGGVAALDADGDGRLDLYFTSGADPQADPPLRNRLLRQRADGTFVDATEASGLGDPGDGQAVAVADVDNDGDVDVFVANAGPDRLYLNRGDGTFVDVAAEAGVHGGDGWSASASFVDVDRDGWLDLFVTRYVEVDPDRACVDEAGRPEFCGPAAFPGLPDRLYRNRGDGTFEDVSEASGIASQALRGLGVVAADLDDDGWPDLFVANDGDPNQLWRNRGDGTFVEDAIIAGAAFNADGRAEAGMGVVAGDPDDDGDLDLFLTHLGGETNTLYRAAGGLGWDDDTGRAGLGSPSVPWTGWGTAFADLDEDGDEDLVVANGAIARHRPPHRDDGSFWGGYAEPNQLYRNDGTGRFERVPDAEAGDFGRDLAVSRGLLPVDLDGDGDLDLVVANVNDPARVYRNDAGRGRSLVIRAVEPALRREAIGARLRLRIGDRTVVRHVLPPGGYASGGPAVVHLALPPERTVEHVDVRWVDGTEERFPGTGPGRLELRRGDGEPRP